MRPSAHTPPDSVGLLLGYSLTLSSYYLLGFQELTRATGVRLDITSRSNERGFAEFCSRIGPHYVPPILMVRATAGGRSLFAAIDLADGSDPTFEYSYQRTVIPFVDAYFKVNLDREALRQD